MSKEFLESSIAPDFDVFTERLQRNNWCVIAADAVNNKPTNILDRIGVMVNQYNGQKEFEITYHPGFDDAPYSQSTNALGAHTEAPSYEPPPKYLALYCHRQARCGKGQTLLADATHFFDEVLDPDLRRWARDNEVEFHAAAKPGSADRQSLRAPIRSEHNGDAVIRFSYNLFRYGNVNPTSDDVSRGELAELDPLGQIAEAGEAYFAENLIPVLIPDGGLLVWNNRRLFHGRGEYSDRSRHLTRYWLI